MLCSMTGFGTSETINELGHFYFEIKTWNNRFIDVNTKLSAQLSSSEFFIINLIKDKISRGKVDVYIKWEPATNLLPNFDINKNALLKIHSEISKIKEQFNVKSDIDYSSILLIPGMTISIPPSIDERKLEATLREGINNALIQVISSRVEEGKKLVNSLKLYINNIEKLLDEIYSVKDQLIDRYRQKLREKVQGLLGGNQYNLEEGRLEVEVLFYAERSDITEEITRLRTHIDLLYDYLKKTNSEPVGKALDFLCQELLRETNTIGSKSRDSFIATNVLKMKNEIEKIREQVQNLE